MAEPVILSPLLEYKTLSLWDKVFLSLSAALSSTILLKVFEIQYIELIFALQILLLLYIFVLKGLRFKIISFCLVLGFSYLMFVVVALSLSALALQSQFYFPRDLTFLKYPIWITIARSIELMFDVGGMLYLVHKFTSNHQALVLAARVYFWTGVASAIYAILTYPLNVLGIADLGTYDIDHRMRGFYNEGGPYGLYSISVLMVGIAHLHFSVRYKKLIYAALVVILIGMLGSRSKAAILAFALILIVDTFLVEGRKMKFGVIVALLCCACAVPFFIDLPGQLRLYQRSSMLYERASKSSYNDYNVVYGRVAGSFIVPRMIKAHPFVGVGWGNYGLVRNDPMYRGASAWATFDDQPSLGIVGTMAELGIPLTICIIIVLFLPFAYLNKIKTPLFIQNLALLQPMVHLFGGQLNLTYPWVVTALALGLGSLYSKGFYLANSSVNTATRLSASEAA